MRLNELVAALQMSISPVIVISGVGLVLLSMTHRYGRVIDRARILCDSLRKTPGDAAVRLAAELAILCRRARLLRLAILLATTSLLCAAVLIIVLFLATVFGGEVVILAVSLFLGAMLTLMASLVVFIFDINASLAAFDLETRIEVVHSPPSSEARL